MKEEPHSLLLLPGMQLAISYAGLRRLAESCKQKLFKNNFWGNELMQVSLFY